MKPLPSCLLYTQDDALVSRLLRLLSSMVAIHPIDDREPLDRWFYQYGATVLIADLRAPDCLNALCEIRKGWPATIIIALGADRSDPMLAVEWLDVFATADLDPERRSFQALIKHAAECFRLRQKTAFLEDELAKLATRQADVKPTARTIFSTPLQYFSKAQQNFDNIDVLFDSVVEGLVASAKVSRAGIFIKKRTGENYKFRSGMRCLEETENLMVKESDPFIRWLERNTHLISRQTLDNIQLPDERIMLRQMLDALGAEIVIPIYVKGRIKGWIFVGQRATGIPFDYPDFEDLTALSDHISTTLETALQYEETALQKALAETLLHSIPFGIIACDEDGIVRWFNNTAQEILRTDEKTVLNNRAETLGSRIADLMRRALDDQGTEDVEWTDPLTKLTLSAQTRQLMGGSSCVGALLLLRDITDEKLFREKEDQLERATFWNELAAGMSHEIRNPLVAIKTFSQLLPERYEDPDFRDAFSSQVTSEVDALNRIIDKINEFANPPKPVFVPLDVHKPIEHAITRLQANRQDGNLKIHLSSDECKLLINGDENSLQEGIYHLLKNAAENLDNKKGSRINITVKGRNSDTANSVVLVTITDNGSGIAPSLRDKIYSPFSTTKARGLGLGLPIAKRAVIDHSGRITIDTSSGGTAIVIALPAIPGASQ
ncbi:MAG: PAS domain-containing protein [Kiritimatiellales bacterium]|nr:PAS domain-containing protein [Kiritimatiellales bacterium]